MAEKNLLANKHNHITTTYYLLQKRIKEHGHLREGMFASVANSFNNSQRIALELPSRSDALHPEKAHLNNTIPYSTARGAPLTAPKPATSREHAKNAESFDVSSTGGSIEKITAKKAAAIALPPNRRPPIDPNRTKIVETSRAE